MDVASCLRFDGNNDRERRCNCAASRAMTAAKGLAEFWTILMVQCGRVPAEKHQRDSNLDIISLILCVAKYKTSEERSRTLGRHRTRHQMGSIYNMWGR